MARRLIAGYSPKLAAIQLSHGSPALPLRPSTALRFILPLTRLVWNRINRKPGAPDSRAELLRELWTVPEVEDMLNPRQMVTRALYEGSVLDNVLRQSRNRHNRIDIFGRILTLELLARAVQKKSQ
jgi:hypothetical protein